MQNQARYAEFPDEQSARVHRNQNGGWIAITCRDGATLDWHWFASDFTPSTIFMSAHLRGLDAKLV